MSELPGVEGVGLSRRSTAFEGEDIALRDAVVEDRCNPSQIWLDVSE